MAAPVELGQVLGTVTFTLGEEILGKYRLTAPEEIKPLTFFIIFKRILQAVAS